MYLTFLLDVSHGPLSQGQSEIVLETNEPVPLSEMHGFSLPFSEVYLYVYPVCTKLVTQARPKYPTCE